MLWRKIAVAVLVAVVAAGTVSTVFAGGAGEKGVAGASGVLSFTATLPHFGIIPTDRPIQGEWQKLMEKMMGTKLDIKYNWVSWPEYQEKLRLMLATGSLTDLTYIRIAEEMKPYDSQGVFLELSQYADLMPNYLKMGKLLPDYKRQLFEPDGKFYKFSIINKPLYSPDKGMAIYFVNAYRYDIFQKHNIKIPETLEELYQAGLKLKQLYPKSYPITRGEVTSVFWDYIPFAYHTSTDIYWNGKEYVFGAVEDRYREAMQYLAKLYKDGLLDTEFVTDNQEIMDRKAMAEVNFVQLSAWYSFVRPYNTNPSAKQTWVIGKALGTEKYGKAWQVVQDANNYTSAGSWQHAVVISPKTKIPKELVKLLDMQYSEQAYELTNWGIEGQTFTRNSDGSPKFVDSIAKAKVPLDEGDKWGIRTSNQCRPGFQLGVDAKAAAALDLPDMCYVDGKVVEKPWLQMFVNAPYPVSEDIPAMLTGPVAPVRPGQTPQLGFTSDEMEVISATMTAVRTYKDEWRLKVVTGKESFDSWDNYRTQLKALGYEKILKLYNDKAAQILGSKK